MIDFLSINHDLALEFKFYLEIIKGINLLKMDELSLLSFGI